MKSKITKGLIAILLLPLLVSCNGKKAEPEALVIDKEQVKNEIQAKENQFAATYNAGELVNIGYYADDATSYAPNRAPIVGREAIIAYLKVDVETNTDKISFTTREVFVSNDGNMVVETGSYQVVDSTGIAFNTGNYMVLFEKRDGKYYCVRDMSVSDMPIPFE
ncbi:MAG: nuclear transport factor 2 family protein [Bacteroidia bacterium]|nr:MAG: nuclear transport factor 2 family protein [Bacteroidia bacterium]